MRHDSWRTVLAAVMIRLVWSTELWGDHDIIGYVATQNGWSQFQPTFSLYPAKIEHLSVNSYTYLNINCSIGATNSTLESQLSRSPQKGINSDDGSSEESVETQQTRRTNLSQQRVSASEQEVKQADPAVNITFIITVKTLDPAVAIPLGDTNWVNTVNRSDEVTWVSRGLPIETYVGIKGLLVGRTLLQIRVTGYLGSVPEPPDLAVNDTQDGAADAGPDAHAHLVVLMEYHVTVVRKSRLVNRCFDVTLAVVVLVNAFSMGCTTTVTCLRQHLRRPTTLVLAASCHFVIMPIVMLGACKLLLQDGPLALGLFVTVCSPGGGAGLLLVTVAGGDRPLSKAINGVDNVLSLGTTLLWLAIVTRFLDPRGLDLLSLRHLAAGMLTHACFYTLGVMLRYYQRAAADAVLNWLSKPLILLTAILFTTLGSYINMYVFAVAPWHVIAAAASLPTLGFLIGLLLASGMRLNADYLRTVVMETTMSNCMLAIVLLRLSLPDPDDDLAVAMPFWVLYTTPLPLAGVYLLASVKRSMYNKCAKRKEKKYRHFSIVSSLVNVTNLSTSVSTKLNSPTDDDVLIDERITVL